MQAEQGAAVVDQIEFHIAATAVELELALRFGVFSVLALLHDGQVGGHIVIADALHDGETSGEVRFVKVIKKQAADAALFVAVFDIKIFITPFFVSGVSVFAKWLTGLFRGLVPVRAVFPVAVVGR